MVERLKSVSRTLNWQLLASALVFGVLLGLINSLSSWWWVLVYCLYAFYIYFYFFRVESGKFFFSFIFFLFISLRLVSDISFGFYDFFIIIFLSALFYILAGLKSLHFHNARLFSGIFYYFLVFLGSAYLIFLSFNFSFWWKIILAFLFYYLVSRDYLIMFFGAFDKRKRIFSLVFSLASVELLWLGSFLSIGFLNAASLVLIFWTVALDLSYHLFSGSLSQKIIIRDTLIFSVFSFLSILLPLVIK